MLTDLRGLQHDWSWSAVFLAYCRLTAENPYSVLAGTFFNTVFRKLADHDRSPPFSGETAKFEQTDAQAMALQAPLQCFKGQQIGPLLTQAIGQSPLAADVADLEREVVKLTDRLTAEIPLLRSPLEQAALELEMLKPIFYRNKGAYLIGRLLIAEHVFPLTIAFTRPDANGVIADAVLWGENKLSVVFSFTRAYFMVETDQPEPLIDYLQQLLPVKRRWELYNAIGYFKHGKTSFVQDFRRELERSSDKFQIAEGIKGQVMCAFSLDSYQMVFKVIKDRFPPTKSVTREDVLAAYKLVKTHDRVGRMADTHEFHDLLLPLARFDGALLEELQRVAAGAIEIEDDQILVRHVYTERLMVPMNLYVQRCSEFQLSQVLTDYGAAIKDLAAANIFPGDMLLKNFGVTRHGRVVFYDYDEICYLTDVNFRTMPSRETDSSSAGQGVQAAGAWFDVGEYDVFPEEFATFLFPDEHIQSIFREQHADLLAAEGWQRIQAQVKARTVTDVFPYAPKDRLQAI